MPSREELIAEYKRYHNYYRQQRIEAGIPSIFEVYWLGHISALVREHGGQIDPEMSDWIRDPAMTRFYSPEVSWKRIVDEIAVCRNCDLYATRTKTVPGSGRMRAEVMVVGEAPGADEDATGLPFVGKSGQELFDNLFPQLMKWDRSKFFIANVLRCRPPGNRAPEPKEVQACHHFLHRTIMLVNPKVIIATGAHAATALGLGFESLKSVLEQVHWYHHIPFVVMPHPSAWLKQKNVNKPDRKPYDYGPYIWWAMKKAEEILALEPGSDFWRK